MTTDEIISEIEGYASRAGLSPATVTSRAVSNSRLYDRMKAGGSCSLKTAGRLRAYMLANPPAQTKGDAA